MHNTIYNKWPIPNGLSQMASFRYRNSLPESVTSRVKALHPAGEASSFLRSRIQGLVNMPKVILSHVFPFVLAVVIGLAKNKSNGCIKIRPMPNGIGHLAYFLLVC